VNRQYGYFIIKLFVTINLLINLTMTCPMNIVYFLYGTEKMKYKFRCDVSPNSIDAAIRDEFSISSNVYYSPMDIEQQC
jgi:hypothetical protein